MIPSELKTTMGDRPWAPLAVVVEPDREARARLATELRRLGCDVYDFGAVDALLSFLPLLVGGRTPDFAVLASDGTARGQELEQQLRNSPNAKDIPQMTYLPRDLADEGLHFERVGRMVRLAVSRRRLLEVNRRLSAPPARGQGRE